jgi:hypothetical protein
LRSLLVVWLQAGALALLLLQLMSRSPLLRRRRLWPLLLKLLGMLLSPALVVSMSRSLVLLRPPLRPLLLPKPLVMLLPPVLAERGPRELRLLPVPAGLAERDSCLRARS